MPAHQVEIGKKIIEFAGPRLAPEDRDSTKLLPLTTLFDRHYNDQFIHLIACCFGSKCSPATVARLLKDSVRTLQLDRLRNPLAYLDPELDLMEMAIVMTSVRCMLDNEPDYNAGRAHFMFLIGVSLNGGRFDQREMDVEKHKLGRTLNYLLAAKFLHIHDDSPGVIYIHDKTVRILNHLWGHCPNYSNLF